MLDPTRFRNHLKLSDHIRLSDDHGSRGSSHHVDFSSAARKASQNCQSQSHGTPCHDDDGSGVHTPPLWGSSPPESPRGHAHNHQNHYRSLSPASRTQAIMRGQMELMEMVKNMPECTYELSLKDLVELPRARQELIPEAQKENDAGCRSGKRRDGDKKRRVTDHGNNRVQAATMMNRSGSIDNNGGFLLKMVFPIAWQPSKKKDNSVNKYSKVSPRPSDGGSAKSGVEIEWWKRRKTSASGESETADSSINSGSMRSSGASSSSSSRSNSINSTKRHGSGGSGCWSFLGSKMTKSKK